MLRRYLIVLALSVFSFCFAEEGDPELYISTECLYLGPVKDQSKQATIRAVLAEKNQKVDGSSRQVLFPGLKIGFHLSESIRLGFAGYYGFGDLTSRSFIVSEKWGSAKVAEVSKNGQGSHSNGLQKILKATLKDLRLTEQVAEVLRSPLDSWLTCLGFSNVFASITTLCGKAVLVNYSNYMLSSYFPEHEGKKTPLIWNEKISPKFSVFTTLDSKLYKNGIFYLNAGVALGATRWGYFCSLEGGPIPAALDSLSDQSSSAWAFSCMSSVEANFDLELATVTFSAGYAYLGSPNKVRFDLLHKKNELAILDCPSSHGWIFGLGLSKSF